MLERTEHGHYVLRAYAKNAVVRMYEKFSTFLRLEALSNNLKDFGLNKGLNQAARLFGKRQQASGATGYGARGSRFRLPSCWSRLDLNP